MRPEYDFRGGERGKHASGFALGTHVIPLDPDVAAVFPDAASVNDALRLLIAVADRARPRVRQKKPKVE